MTRLDAPGSDPVDATERSANLIRRINLGDTLTRTARRTPARLAIVDGERRVDYGTFNELVNRLANALLTEGYRRGDSLALLSANSLEFLQTYYACAKVGVVCVPINAGWRATEIGYVLGHALAKGVVVESQLLDQLMPALDASPDLRNVLVAPGTNAGVVPSVAGRRCVTLEDLSSASKPDEPEVYVDDRDPLSYLYTSGTTSAPKGVVSSHAAVCMESMTAALEFRFTAEDRTVAMMPLFHTAQLNGVVTPIITVGGSVIMRRSFEPASLLAAIEEERATHIFGLPMMYRALPEHGDLDRRDISSLRRAMYAMAPMPDEDLRQAIERLDCDLCLGFGQTEMNPLTTVLQPKHQFTHTGAVGTAVVNVAVDIVDDDGETVPTGTSGEIVYRGPHAMEGYLRDPAATADAFADGWFHSGDIGHLDQEGVVWFEDRKKDVIKTGGENVSSIDVERALFAVDPGIAEVVVVGLPHDRWGEAITAVITLRPGSTFSEERLLAAVRKRLSGFKTPKAVIIVDDLPRTSTGKVQKHVLRQQFRDRFKRGADTDDERRGS